MDFQDLVKDRFSVRKFKEQTVKEEDLAMILEAGRVAPTAHNNQPQRIKVITSAEDLGKVDQVTNCRFGATTVLLICYDRNLCWERSFDKAHSGEVDASIITTHFMLAVQALGLGTCWVMNFDPFKTRELFDLPENIVPMAILPIGYPADDAKPFPRHFERVELEDLML